MNRLRFAVVALALSSLVACSSNRPPASSPAQPTAGAQAERAPQASPPPPPAATGAPTATYAQPPATGTAPGVANVPGKGDKADGDLSYPDAVNLFEKQARELSASLSQCTEACRALASIERAARRICAVGEDAVRCDDAKARLREARMRVRERCKECSGGASTDPNAPI